MLSSNHLRVGVIGCGGIAQMMHLPFLFGMPDRFEIAALSDISPGLLQAMGKRYQVPEKACFTNFYDLISQPIDAVLVLTSGDHFPQALGALRNGLHVFVEKPMCFSLHEADQLIASAKNARRKLMVGYMKRFDPGYQYAQECLAKMSSVRFVQINTLHPSEEDYLAIHNLLRFDDVPKEKIQELRQADDLTVREAVGNIPPSLANLYTEVFLGSMVHDINAMRGLLGEPEGILYAEQWPADQPPGSITTVIKYPSDIRVVYTWTYLHELRNYFQEIALMSSANRLRIQWPSPYLRHFPTPVVFEGMEGNSAYEKRVMVSYDEAFRRELIDFHDCIVNDRPPLTGAEEARKDIYILQQILAALHPQGLGGEAAASLDH